MNYYEFLTMIITSVVILICAILFFIYNIRREHIEREYDKYLKQKKRWDI